MKRLPENTTFYFPLKVYPHNFDNAILGDGLIPLYYSEEDLLKYNPGIPYIEITQLNHKISVIVRGIKEDQDEIEE